MTLGSIHMVQLSVSWKVQSTATVNVVQQDPERVLSMQVSGSSRSPHPASVLHTETWRVSFREQVSTKLRFSVSFSVWFRVSEDRGAGSTEAVLILQVSPAGEAAAPPWP